MTETEDFNARLPKMRVLYCRTCRAFEEMPWHDDERADWATLDYVVSKHPGHEAGGLFLTPIGVWLHEPSRRELQEQVAGKGATGLDALSPGFYDTRNTLREDALDCYKRHLRPKEGCPDYMSDSKKLYPDTKAERKDAGLSLRPVGPTSYLCYMCPVKTYYERKNRGD